MLREHNRSSSTGYGFTGWSTEVAFSGKHAETRGYAIDALSKASAVAALKQIRDRSVAHLRTADPGSRTDDLARLESIGIQHGALLKDACELLSEFVTTTDETDRNLAATAILCAAGAGVDSHDKVVNDLFTAAVTADSPIDYNLYGDSTDILADVAVSAPDLVLEPCIVGLGLQPPAQPPASDTGSSDQTWDTETAWGILLEIGRKSPATLQARLDTEQLLWPGDCAAPATARQLYAEIVTQPFSVDHIGLVEVSAWMWCEAWRWPFTEFCAMVLRAAWTVFGVRRSDPANHPF